MQLVYKHKFWRFLEMVPGLLAWGALLFPIVIAIYQPILVAVLAIVYALLWLFRSIRLSINLYRGYRRTQDAMRVNWNYLLDLVENPEKIDKAVSEADLTKHLLRPQKIFNLELKNIKNRVTWLKQNDQYLKPSQIHHAILMVTYKESYEVVRESVKSDAESSISFPSLPSI